MNLISLALFFFVFLIRLYFHKKANTASQKVIKRKGDVLQKWGNATLGLALILFIILSQFKVTNLRIDQPLVLNYTGLIFGLIGIFLFFLSHKSLDRNWSHKIQIHKNQTLTTDGIYKFTRHPMYLSGSLIYLSLGLMNDNVIVKIICSLYIFLTLLRIPKEENLLKEHFKKYYIIYQNFTNRFTPRVPLIQLRSNRSRIILASLVYLLLLAGMVGLLNRILTPFGLWELPLYRLISLYGSVIIILILNKKLYWRLFDFFPQSRFFFGLREDNKISLHFGKNMKELRKLGMGAFRNLSFEFYLCLALLIDGKQHLSFIEDEIDTLQLESPLLWFQKKDSPHPYFNSKLEHYLNRQITAKTPTKKELNNLKKHYLFNEGNLEGIKKSDKIEKFGIIKVDIKEGDPKDLYDQVILALKELQ